MVFRLLIIAVVSSVLAGVSYLIMALFMDTPLGSAAAIVGITSSAIALPTSVASIFVWILS